MSARCFTVGAVILLLFANGAQAARYQRTKDGKALVWNNLRGVAQEVTWSGLRDLNGYATGEGTLTWYRMGSVVNSYTGKMVRGKFEGVVIREQGQTRFETTFVNGEKAGGWSEPGSTARRTPTPVPQETVQPKAPEEPLVEQPSPSPTPRPSPTSTPRPTRSPSSTPTPSPTLTPLPTVSSVRPTPSPFSTPLRFLAPSPVEQPAGKRSRLEEVIEGPVHDSLELASRPSSPRNALEEVPWLESSPTSLNSPTQSPSAIPQGADKARIIAKFKEETESVLAQVIDATANFREINRLDGVLQLPAPVSANVASLAYRARDFRAKLGYDIAFHECRIETETVDALTVVDQVTRSIASGDAPAARMTLFSFLKRYPEPPSDNRKLLWRYFTSALSLCNRLKNEAETHLERAQSLGSDGKTSEALREYREIYRIYPSPVIAEKIRKLETQPR